MKISIVIPAHNEEKNVEKIISLLLNNFDDYIKEIIIVNDCSTDNTALILNKLKKKIKKIKPLHRKGKNGVGNAIKDGLRIVDKSCDYVLLLDCDFVENIKDIKEMLKQVSDFDGLVGSRYMKKGSLVNYPTAKKIANRAFHKLIHLLLRIKHVDLTNNFKLYKMQIVERILPLLESEGFSINAETGLYPVLLGYRIKEIPVSWIGRTTEMGSSNFQVIKAGPGYVRVLIKALIFKYFNQRGKL